MGAGICAGKGPSDIVGPLWPPLLPLPVPPGGCPAGGLGGEGGLPPFGIPPLNGPLPPPLDGGGGRELAPARIGPEDLDRN